MSPEEHAIRKVGGPYMAITFLATRHGGGCENVTTRTPGRCFTDGNTHDAEYGADTCCVSCIAWAALQNVARRRS